MHCSTHEKEFAFNIIKRQINACLDAGNGAPPHPENVAIETAAGLFWDSMVDNGVMHLGKAKLPDIRWFGGWNTFPLIYADTFLIHHLFDDEYSKKNVNMLEDMMCEGPYCYENVRVEPGDTVIDAGAYIGDTASLFSAMGGTVYAFDPSPSFKEIMCASAQLSKFEPVFMGLGEREETLMMNVNTAPGGNQFNPIGTVPLPITTVDAFAAARGIKVDFIKSDIEGMERFMLNGAKETLARDCPKLSIRTYHFYDDRQLLPAIVKKANPKYKIIYGRNCFYAYVP